MHMLADGVDVVVGVDTHKSDSLDAARAAREALGRRHVGEPRTHGERQALSVLLAVRRAAVEASSVGQRQLHRLVVAAPERLRSRFRGLATPAMVRAAARLRVDPRWDTESRVIAAALRSVAQRVRELDAEAAAHEREIEALVRAWRPDLLELLGVGPINAAVVLCAWSHAGRLRSEAAFAMLGGAAPIPASSGQTVRHRLNRSGDRQLNRALHTVVIHRLRLDPSTKAYAEARRAEGKTDREIKRCLKRYVARQLFRQLERGPIAT